MIAPLPSEATEQPAPLMEPTPLEPTAVPPTPTPATETYAIQPGDTLLGLALARGIELSELQALNPGVQAESLQIGQQIILPAAPLAPPASTGESVSESLVSSEPQVVADEQGLWVLGQVTNDGVVALAPAQLTITVYGADGAELTTATAWTAGRRIDPGSTAPYAYYFPGLTAAGSTATVTVQPPGLAGVPTWPDLRVEDITISEGSGAVEVNGRLVNGGNQAIRDLLLTVTFYDAAGRYTGYRHLERSDTLKAGESVPIQMAALPIHSSVDSVVIQIDALPAE